MDLTKLLEKQKLLDDRIEKAKGLQGEDLLNKKILALLVELSELANELPEVFKFWSDKNNNYENALEEYVDVFHFILSIGNDLSVSTTVVENVFSEEIKEIDKHINDMFLSLYFDLSKLTLVNIDRETTYSAILIRFKMLGNLLGFTWEQIIDAYYDKNKVNHERQDNGY